MQVFIRKPSVDLYAGIKVDKDTKLEFENENVTQKVENLVFTSVTRVNGEGYNGIYNTTVYLEEGDVLIFEEEGRGYIKPVQDVCTIAEAIEDLTNIKDLGD